MDPGRYHHSRTARLLWLGMPPALLVALSGLVLGFERLVHERLQRTRALQAVLPVVAEAARAASQAVAPLAPDENATETAERLHARLTGLVRGQQLVLNNLAIDRHDEQPLAGALRFRISASVEGGLPDLAGLLARMQEAEPLLVLEAGRWSYLRTEPERAEEIYRADLLFSLYRVTP